MKPEDQLIELGGKLRCDKPAVLHTYLHQKGLLLPYSCAGPDKKDKNPSAVASALSVCNGTVASGTVNDVQQVIFLLLNVLFDFVLFTLTCIQCTVKLWIEAPGLYLGPGLYAGPGFYQNMSKLFIFTLDAL